MTRRTSGMAIGLVVLFLFLFASLAKAEPLPGFRLEGERWTYEQGDLRMSGVLVRPEGKGPFPALLISHGKGGSASSFSLRKAKEFAAAGYVCIAPDYTHAGAPPPGAGRPPGPAAGRFSREDGASEENVRRATKCLDILESLPQVDAKRLFAYGHSMGGFVTIALAAAEPDRLKAAAITGSGVAPRDGYPAPSVERAGTIKTPMLMIHGDADRVVQPDQSKLLKEALDRNGVANERHVLAGVGHDVDRANGKEVLDFAKSWFARHGDAAKEK